MHYVCYHDDVYGWLFHRMVIQGRINNMVGVLFIAVVSFFVVIDMLIEINIDYKKQQKLMHTLEEKLNERT